MSGFTSSHQCWSQLHIRQKIGIVGNSSNEGLVLGDKNAAAVLVGGGSLVTLPPGLWTLQLVPWLQFRVRVVSRVHQGSSQICLLLDLQSSVTQRATSGEARKITSCHMNWAQPQGTSIPWPVIPPNCTDDEVHVSCVWCHRFETKEYVHVLGYDLLFITKTFLKDRHCFLVVIRSESKAKKCFSSWLLHKWS